MPLIFFFESLPLMEMFPTCPIHFMIIFINYIVSPDGDQCLSEPCKNGAMCSDSVGGYDCICKSGFSGVHCETGEKKKNN